MKRIYSPAPLPLMGPKGRKRSGQPKSASLLLADIGLHDTHVLLGDKPGHSRNVPLNFYLVGAAVRGLHITSDYGLLTCGWSYLRRIG
jgi:hypothetical protein